MKSFSQDELARSAARTRATELLLQSPVIQGTLVESERTCGTATCRCHGKGPKHSATYLAVRHKGKRAMFCVPDRLLEYVKECVGNHQRLQQTLEIISRDCLNVFLLKKKRQRK
jgi:hypothetical protein